MIESNCLIENIIFDLDGTLIDSVEDVAICLQKAYSMVCNINEIKISRFDIGPPLYNMIKKLSPDLNEEQIESIIAIFRNCYDSSDYNKTFLYSGVRELLIKLKEGNIKLFLATNKPIIPTKKIVKKLRIEYFLDIVTSDSEHVTMNKTEIIGHLIKKWNMDEEKTIMIGDTPSDVIASHNNSISSVALLKGYGDIKSLYDSKPTYTIEHIEDFFFMNIFNERGQNHE